VEKDKDINKDKEVSGCKHYRKYDSRPDIPIEHLTNNAYSKKKLWEINKFMMSMIIKSGKNNLGVFIGVVLTFLALILFGGFDSMIKVGLQASLVTYILTSAKQINSDNSDIARSTMDLLKNESSGIGKTLGFEYEATRTKNSEEEGDD
jgi:hypothetical protein